MRNIIGLLYRYNAVLLFIVLQVAAFALIVTYSPYHRSSYFNSSNTLIGNLKDITHSINEPFIALSENKELRKENAELRDLLIYNFYDLSQTKTVVNDTAYDQQFTHVSAQVIDNSYDRIQNYLLLNAGSSQGIEREMGVIGRHGLVGFVKDVSSKYSLVIPVLNPNFSTSVKLKKNDYFGMISWEGGDAKSASIERLSKNSSAETGDTVVTKGANGRFPAGIPVGVITSAKEVSGDNNYEVEIDLFTNFENLHHCFVLINHHRQEFQSLRDSIPSDNE